MTLDPLIDDSYVDTPRQRTLDKLLRQRASGMPVVGVYCSYAPIELIWAMGGTVADLCAYANKTIPDAETVLPSSLCPLIKSSYGFIITDQCPFYAISDVVIGETTCDGKKKMFELIRDIKSMIVLELPQKPDDVDARIHWEAEVWKMKAFLEQTFSRRITDDDLESAIKAANRRRKLLTEIIAFAGHTPPHISWWEVKAIIGTAYPSADTSAMDDLLEDVLRKLHMRRSIGEHTALENAPRVMVTGCPIGGDAEKVFRIIEEAGGVVVMHEACSGIKPLLYPVEEETGDPLAAIARRYLQLPCSCMTPNHHRLELIDRLIEDFKPDAVVDVVLSGCHTYNVESFTIREHVSKKHGLPFLKLETDYSESDAEQIRTRVEALMELCGK